MKDLRGKRISILGAVRSGIGAAKLAKKIGAIPFVSDIAPEEKLKDVLYILKQENIEYETGGHTGKVYGADFIVTSPGVPSDSTVLQLAKEKGIEVISEIEFASLFCKGSIIAITGTNGKTTTTTLCAHVLNSAGKTCHLAGNIGKAFSEIVLDVKENEFVALEVSSFQLDFIKNFKPDISVLLNITPDHLNRYNDDFNLYIKSKMRIFKNQTNNDYLIYNFDDEIVKRIVAESKTELIPFSIKENPGTGVLLNENKIVFISDENAEEICDVSDLSLKGEHNLMNSMAVIGIAKTFGIKNEVIKEALGTFQGVEHRLELVRELNEVKYINDSKATNIDSVWYALRSFESNIYLILGGQDKGNDYNRIKDLVKERVKKIYAIGSSAEKIYDFFKEIVPVEIVNSFDECLTKAKNEATTGSVVLLSPACASFDMFRNYEERGKIFKEAVNRLK